MPRKSTIPELGISKPVYLHLPADLAVDLHAFCEANYGASRTRVICDALKRFLDHELESNEAMRIRFLAKRQQLVEEMHLAGMMRDENRSG